MVKQVNGIVMGIMMFVIIFIMVLIILIVNFVIGLVNIINLIGMFLIDDVGFIVIIFGFFIIVGLFVWIGVRGGGLVGCRDMFVLVGIVIVVIIVFMMFIIIISLVNIFYVVVFGLMVL